jgi:hypothetical protein
MSYQPKVYRAQGGDEFVVASSGVITVESGGSVAVESGGSVDVESGGSINLASGSAMYESVVTASTAAALSNSGISNIGASATAKAYTIAPPVAGCRKVLVSSAVSTATATVIPSTTGVTLDLTANRKATFNAVDEALELVGLSATQWLVVSNTGSVGLGAT